MTDNARGDETYTIKTTPYGQRVLYRLVDSKNRPIRTRQNGAVRVLYFNTEGELRKYAQSRMLKLA